MIDIIIFNVELGQCIFIYPRHKPEYTAMIDCGNTVHFEPVDFLLNKNFLVFDQNEQKYFLNQLVLTNYDQDHFSGLPYLRSKVLIKTVRLPKNMNSVEITNLKTVITEPIRHLIYLMDSYTENVLDDLSPYRLYCDYLTQDDFTNESIDTNKLSQIVFFTYNGTSICIPGDLTSTAWDKLLTKLNIQILLKSTDILIAPHHGREDGYNENIFAHCNPEVIILSDRDIVHKTQEGQTQLYSSKIKGNGIILNSNYFYPRKTLTTRSDGHLWIRIEDNGTRIYRSFQI